MIHRSITTELYEKVGQGGEVRYITVRKTDDSNDRILYTIEKQRGEDGRSRAEVQFTEDEARTLLALLKEMLEGKE